VIASVVIGGGSLSGGSGSIAGALIGAFLMTVIKTGCTHVGLPNWVQELLTGAIIVTAVGLDRLRRGRERAPAPTCHEAAPRRGSALTRSALRSAKAGWASSISASTRCRIGAPLSRPCACRTRPCSRGSGARSTRWRKFSTPAWCASSSRAPTAGSPGTPWSSSWAARSPTASTSMWRQPSARVSPDAWTAEEERVGRSRRPGFSRRRPPPRPSSRPRRPERRPAAGGQLLPALRVIHELCLTLAYLHGEGIIHRDLKPENILLDADGAPVLVDFGLAARSPWRGGREILDIAATQGTVAYMAPEQILGQFVDARTDLYAVGCLLYEAVTGRPPFLGERPAKVIGQHLSAAPRVPSDFVDGVPLGLDSLILRLLQKSPRKRPGHAADVAPRARRARGRAAARGPDAPGAGLCLPARARRAEGRAHRAHRAPRARRGRPGERGARPRRRAASARRTWRSPPPARLRRGASRWSPAPASRSRPPRPPPRTRRR